MPIASSGIFETHLTVGNLGRSMDFYGRALGFELAHVIAERRVAFYWVGPQKYTMLGVWETGSGPQRLRSHTAFRVELSDLFDAPEHLRDAGITPLDFWDQPASEPVVFGWTPAASLFFKDPDGNLLEYIAVLAEEPRPELGIVPWSAWERARPGANYATVMSPMSSTQHANDYRRRERHDQDR